MPGGDSVARDNLDKYRHDLSWFDQLTVWSSAKRRPSETAVVDPTRAVEETEESATRKSRSDKSDPERARSPPRGAPIPIKLGKKKWPDNLICLD